MKNWIINSVSGLAITISIVSVVCTQQDKQMEQAMSELGMGTAHAETAAKPAEERYCYLVSYSYETITRRAAALAIIPQMGDYPTKVDQVSRLELQTDLEPTQQEAMFSAVHDMESLHVGRLPPDPRVVIHRVERANCSSWTPQHT